MKIKNYKIIYILLVVYTFIAFILGYYDYYYKKQNYYEFIDKNLAVAAKTLRYIIPEEVQDGPFKNELISKNIDKTNTLHLSEFIKDTGITYIYTMIFISNAVYFTSSSASDEDILKDNVYNYMEKYDEVDYFTFQSLKFPEKSFEHKITIRESSDRWGSFRSIIYIEKTSNGNYYLIGADCDIKVIKKDLQANLIKVISMFLCIWLLGLIFIQFLFSTKKRQYEIEKEREIILNNIEDSIIEYVDIKTRKILWLNDYAKRKFGITETDLKNKCCFENIFKRTTPCEECLLNSVISDKKKKETERKIFEDYYIVKSFPILNPFSQKVEKVINFATDITKIKKLEEQLADSLKSKDQFLSNMSHEIKTPMVAMQNYIQILKNSELSEKQMEFIDILDTQSKSLISIINNILDLTNLKFKPFILRNVTFNLDQLTKDLVSVFDFMAKEKNLLFFTDINENVKGLNLIGDADKIKQILSNLLSNAIKYTVKGFVQIFIEKDWDFKIKQNQIAIRFTVTDTGIGIDNDKFEEIFEPFTQIPNSETEKYNGVGLGLSISKKLIEKMGSKIYVDSVVNKGSKFHFTLILDIFNK